MTLVLVKASLAVNVMMSGDLVVTFVGRADADGTDRDRRVRDIDAGSVWVWDLQLLQVSRLK